MRPIDFTTNLPSYAHFARDDVQPPTPVQHPFGPLITQLIEARGLTRTFLNDSNLANQLSGCLAAPRTLYHLLNYLGRQGRPDINVLYLGAEVYECLDQGRWFSLYHQLNPLAPLPNITVIGPGLANLKVMDQATSLSQQLQIDTPPCIEAVYPTTLQAAVNSHQQLRIRIERDYFDLVVLHQPGTIDPGGSWLIDAGMPWLLEVARPRIAGTAFCVSDLVIDLQLTSASNRHLRPPQVNPEPHQQRYFNDLAPNSRWGHLLWALAEPGDDIWTVSRNSHTELLDQLFTDMDATYRQLDDHDLRGTLPCGLPGDWQPDNNHMALASGWQLDTQKKTIRIDTGRRRFDAPLPPACLDLINPGMHPIERARMALDAVRLVVADLIGAIAAD